jgi:hypothetical protein
MPSSDRSTRFPCKSCGQPFGLQSRTGDEHGNLPWLVVVDGEDEIDYDEVLAKVSCQGCLTTPYSGSEDDSLMAKLAVIAPEGVVPAMKSSVPGRAPVGIAMALMPTTASPASGFMMAGIMPAPAVERKSPGIGIVMAAPQEVAMPSPAFAAAVFAGRERQEVGVMMIEQVAPPSPVGVMAIPMPVIQAPPRSSAPRRPRGLHTTIGDVFRVSLDVVEARGSETRRGRIDADEARRKAGHDAKRLGVSHPLAEAARVADEVALRVKQERFDERLEVLSGLIKRLKRTSNNRLVGKIAVRLAEIDSQLCGVHATDPEERSHRAILELAGATQVWLQDRFRDRLICECEDADVTRMSGDVLNAFLLMELDPEILSLRKLQQVFSSAEEGGGGNSESKLEFKVQCSEGEVVATVTLSSAEHARVCKELLLEEVRGSSAMTEGDPSPCEGVEFVRVKPLDGSNVFVRSAREEPALEPLPTIPEGSSVGLSAEVCDGLMTLPQDASWLLAYYMSCCSVSGEVRGLLDEDELAEDSPKLVLECMDALAEAVEKYVEGGFQWATTEESKQTEVAPTAPKPEADLHV